MNPIVVYREVLVIEDTRARIEQERSFFRSRELLDVHCRKVLYHIDSVSRHLVEC